MEEKVITMIAKQLGIKDLSKITMESDFVKDLKADSVDLVSLSFSLEAETGREIPEEDFEKFKTVGDVINYVKSLS